PETSSAAGKTLILNGAGLRTRFFFKVYVIGLYLERPATDAGAVLGTDSVRRAELHMLRALAGPEIASAIGSAFEQNAGDAAPGLLDRLERFESMFPAVEAGDTLAPTSVRAPSAAARSSAGFRAATPSRSPTTSTRATWASAACASSTRTGCSRAQASPPMATATWRSSPTSSRARSSTRTAWGPGPSSTPARCSA